MRANRRKICCLVALLMLITGMCFENIKADSCFGYTFQEGTALVQGHNVILNSQRATMPEAFVARYAPGMRQVINPATQLRRDWKLTHVLPNTETDSNLLSKFFLTDRTVYLHDTVLHTVVLNYIHNMDGKKKI